MNYRHAFHAGNFADVLKHVVLMMLVEHLKKKPAPFFYLDTHAGGGRYDLSLGESQRSGEYKQGIGRAARVPRGGPAARDRELRRGWCGPAPVPDAARSRPTPARRRSSRSCAAPRTAWCMAETHAREAQTLRAAFGRERLRRPCWRATATRP